MSRLTLISAEVVGRLRPEEPVERWQRELLAAGLLAEVGLPEAPTAAEREAVRLLRQEGGGIEARLRGLSRAEASVAELAHPFRWMRGSVHPIALALIALLLYALPKIWLTFAALSDMHPMVEAMGVPVIVLLIALPALGWMGARELDQRRRYAAAKAIRAAAGRALHADMARVAALTVVLPTPSGWLIGAPDRAWLQAGLAALRERRTLPERLEWREAVGALNVALEPMDALLLRLGHAGLSASSLSVPSLSVAGRLEATATLSLPDRERLAGMLAECGIADDLVRVPV